MAAGIPVDEPYLIHGQFLAEHGVRDLTALLSLSVPPTAIFAAHGLITSGIPAEARDVTDSAESGDARDPKGLSRQPRSP
ncbi:hypothetical protein [Streptomyces sp. NPDC001315]|uniref:hypothetical protein n=1 Tax=Streptomyces sp. NPDC001315 TaxID=3364562 RepID=UPI0036AD5DA6